MKRAFLSLLLLAAFRPLQASEFKATDGGAFISVEQHGGFSANTVSVRKSAVLSVKLEGKKVTLMTTAVEAVSVTMDSGKERKIDRSVSYEFNNDGESDAKTLYDVIMKALAS